MNIASKTGVKKRKVFFYFGNEIGLKTKVSKGCAWLDDSGLHVEGPGGLVIPRGKLYHAKLFRLHGLGRVIQVEFAGGRLFLAVIRLMISQFAFINFLETGALHKELEEEAAR